MAALKPLLRLAFLLLAACWLPAAAHAQAAPSCPVGASPSWTPTEAWVWSNLCTGYVADLTMRDNAALSMTASAPWPADRTISASFLESLLTDPHYALDKYGAGPIIISGARIQDPVKIVDADLKNQVILDSSRFDGGLDIQDSTSSKGLFLRHDMFGAPINIQRSSFQLFWLRTGSAPAMNISDDNFDDSVLLESATIPGTLTIAATKIGTGGLTMQSAHNVDSKIGQMLVLGSTINGPASISNAHFAGEFGGGQTTFGDGLDITDSSFTGIAYFQDADFVRSVDVHGSSFGNDLRFDMSKFESSFSLENDNLCLLAKSCELFLADASFGGKVSIEGTLINGDLNADGATAASVFEMRNDGNAQYPLSVTMIKANFTSDLMIDATALARLQLSNATITGTLQLDLPGKLWSKNSLLNLQGANIGVLENYYWTWPDKMFLDGFHFGSIGLKFPDLDTGCIDGGWSHWLGNTGDYSQQPYQQVAKYLTDSGNASAASCVLQTGQWRTLGGMRPLRRAVYWTYGQVAGYGFAPERSFVYVALFVLIGMLVLRLTGQGRKHGMPIGLFYSFSQLIPLVSLDKRFEDIELTGAARYYFYLHKIIGYFIALFVAAAISSLSGKG